MWSSSLRPQNMQPARDSLRFASAAPYHGVRHFIGGVLDKTYFDLIDTAIKIGLGATITGLSTYFLAKRNHTEEEKKLRKEDTRNLIKEVAEKLESVESSFNDAALSYHMKEYTEAKKSIAKAADLAYSARAISNIIGSDHLLIATEKVSVKLEDIYAELTSTEPNIDLLDSMGTELTGHKKEAYPHIRTAYGLTRA